MSSGSRCCCIARKSVTSHGTASARPPLARISATTAFARSAEKSFTYTQPALWAAKCSAICLPTPCPAPVINAFSPLRSRMFIVLLSMRSRAAEGPSCDGAVRSRRLCAEPRHRGTVREGSQRKRTREQRALHHHPRRQCGTVGDTLPDVQSRRVSPATLRLREVRRARAQRRRAAGAWHVDL